MEFVASTGWSIVGDNVVNKTITSLSK